MTKLNTNWALNELQSFLHASERIPTGEMTRGGNPKTDYRVGKEEYLKLRYVAAEILRRVFPERRIYWYSSAAVREDTLAAIAQLERAQELRENLGDEAPSLSGGELHPWVWESARPFWSIGQYNAGIWTSIVRLNGEVQRKLERRDVSEADAFAQAFTLDAPAPGKPRLRLMADDGSKTYLNRQRGALLLAQGLFAGLRNPLGHDVLMEPGPQEAIETLAAVSLLARWVDDAEVVHSDNGLPTQRG